MFVEIVKIILIDRANEIATDMVMYILYIYMCICIYNVYTYLCVNMYIICAVVCAIYSVIIRSRCDNILHVRVYCQFEKIKLQRAFADNCERTLRRNDASVTRAYHDDEDDDWMSKFANDHSPRLSPNRKSRDHYPPPPLHRESEQFNCE